MAWLGNNFHINANGPLDLGRRFDRGNEFGQVQGRRRRLIQAKLAVEVSEIYPGGQGFAPFPLNIFAHVLFDRLKDAGIGFRGVFKWKSFLHS